MSIKKWVTITLMITIILSITLIVSAQKDLTEYKEITWSSVSLGSSAHMILTSIGSVINRHEPSLKITVQPTGGSMENPRLIADEAVDICHTTMGYNAFHGLADFKEDGPLEDLMFLFTLYENAAFFITRADSDIYTMEDLAGKTVSFMAFGSAARSWSTVILEAYGLFDEVKPTFPGISEQYDLLRDGAIDAAITYHSGNIPSPTLYQADTTMDLRYLKMDRSLLEKATEQYSWYGTTTVTADTLDGLDEDIVALADYSSQYADSRMSEEVAYKIIKTIYENVDEITTYHKLGKSLKLEKALAGAHPDIPVHPGAAKYYKEMGVWRDYLKVGTLQ